VGGLGHATSLPLTWPRLAAVAAFVFWAILTSPLAGADASVYYAAGERLNAGHELYAISPGDRAIPLLPEYGMYPLLSPPLMAVIFRPLALLPIELARGVWVAAQIVVVAVTIAVLARDRGSAVTAILLSLGLGLTVVGNVNTFVLAGAVVAWRYRARPHVGALVALLAAVKLLPIALLSFMIAQRDGRHLTWFAVGGTLAASLSIVGAGWDAHVMYLEVVRTAPPQPGSFADVTGIRWLNTAIFVAGVILAALLPAAASFRTAIVTMVFGAPGMGPAAASQLLAVEAQDGLTIRQRLPVWILAGVAVGPSLLQVALTIL